MKKIMADRRKWLTAAIGLLIILSWAGSLDKYSDDYTNSAIIQAGSAYAVARGINATVSVLQTSTVSASAGVGVTGGGSIMIGEFLDPLNDLIERFSEVMTVALGSLVMQKVLITIAANKLFSGLLTLLGFVSVWLLWMEKKQTYSLAVKLFVLLVVVRFSLGIVVLSNSLVSGHFLSGHIEESSSRLGVLKNDINNLQREHKISLQERKRIEKSIAADKQSLKKMNDITAPKLTMHLQDIKAQLTRAESALELAKKEAGFIAGHNPLTKNKEINVAQSSIDKLEAQRDRGVDQIDRLKQNKDSVKQDISNKRKMLDGDSEDLISTYNGLKQTLSASAIEAKVSSFVQNIIDLLMLFILKAILIPLMFFYLFMRLAKAAWRMDWGQVIACEK